MLNKRPALIVADLGGHEDQLKPLSLASSLGQDAICASLLRHGADPNEVDVDGNTPLHNAAFHNFTNIVSLLLDHGAKVNVTNAFGETPINIARSSQSTTTLGILIRYQALGR
jgi:ankyrin repeat protein